MIIIIILTAIASLFAGHIFGKWIIMLWLTRWNYNKKLFCNDCEIGYTTTFHEVKNYKYCPICGKPLTYFYMDERYQKEEEKALERPNQLAENEIEELIQKGWTLISWKDRYGKGIIAAIVPNEYQAYKLQDILTGADNESLNLTDFCNEQNLPVVSSEDLKTAMLLLNWKVSKFINSPDIFNKIISDYEYIAENDWNKA